MMISFFYTLNFFILLSGLLAFRPGSGARNFSLALVQTLLAFISTHFYINKYEYRDEWLALSHQLQGARNERDVIKALRKVLAESLYTSDIFIWLDGGRTFQGYKLVSSPEGSGIGSHATR